MKKRFSFDNVSIPNEKRCKQKNRVVLDDAGRLAYVISQDYAHKHIKYDSEKEKGKIIFKSDVAPGNIREKYLYKNVKGLYKRGEANPVKVFMA